VSDVILDRRDLSFQLFEVQDTDSLFAHPRFEDHSRETIEEALDTAEKLAGKNSQTTTLCLIKRSRPLLMAKW